MLVFPYLVNTVCYKCIDIVFLRLYTVQKLCIYDKANYTCMEPYKWHSHDDAWTSNDMCGQQQKTVRTKKKEK